MLPFVPAGIGQFQTLAYLFQSDAAAAFVGFALGVVAVGDFATYFMHILAEIYTDMAGLGGRDAMFESILYEGDEYQRGNLRRAVGTNIETRFNSDVGRETDAHQGDVVLDEIHFLA